MSRKVWVGAKVNFKLSHYSEIKKGNNVNKFKRITPKPASLIKASAILALGVGLNACSSGSNTSSGTSTTQGQQTQAISVTFQAATFQGQSGQPQFSPSDLNIKKGAKVTLTIVSTDTGNAPLPTGLTQYDNVQGGTETVDGTSVTNVPNDNVAHTFSVPALGLNAVIPVVPSGKTSTTVVFTFTANKAGTYTWKCLAPCGSGSDGMSGPMATMGWMEGNFVVS